MEQSYYGLCRCGHPNCSNFGYYQTDIGVRCGTHSRKIARTQLPKPNAIIKQLSISTRKSQEDIDIETARQANVAAGKRGNVIVTKLRMMKAPEHYPGYLKVFPNNRHQDRTDGFGCCSLSPMRLGPVEHGQPGLPPAKNIENFHQGSKCFAQEVDADGEPSLSFERNRLRFYTDDVPHRHKFTGTDKTNKNIPLYFVWVDKDGAIHKLDYVTSRQFYCNFYERLSASSPDLDRLKQLIDAGTNIQIIGYDGRSVGHRPVEAEYLDPSAPFGHELVLYTLLTHSPSDYPWRNHKTFDF